MILVTALVMIAFGLSEAIGGNAFLTVYLMGILLGNSNIRGKETLIPFFDGMTGLAQIVLFFLLGLLSFPHKLPQIFFVSCDCHRTDGDHPSGYGISDYETF